MIICQICKGKDWLDLPNPNSNFSVTTASRIVKQPLGKSQCVNCGFVQRTEDSFLGLTDYYEKEYANYYERPGTEPYHKERYKVIIDWMCELISEDHQIECILDVGCGQGWAMEALRKKFPNTKIDGVEPSNFNTKQAREKGFIVYEGKLEDVTLEQKYDLVFSNNVIQHVNDAHGFVNLLAELVNENGLVLNTCPDGSKPNVELLWSDQNFSFLPNHMEEFAKVKNKMFKYSYWSFSPTISSLPPAQLLLLTNNPLYDSYKLDIAKIDKQEIYNLRREYLSSFAKIDEFLTDSVREFEHVYNYGASYWTSILAVYCPNYWEKVIACVIDDVDIAQQFMGKEVLRNEELNKADSILVLGTSPAGHKNLKTKLMPTWNNIINWEKFIYY